MKMWTCSPSFVEIGKKGENRVHELNDKTKCGIQLSGVSNHKDNVLWSNIKALGEMQPHPLEQSTRYMAGQQWCREY